MIMSDALEFKNQLNEYCHSGKDLYIDIKEINEIDLNGLSSLLIARSFTRKHGGDLYVFADRENPIFELLSDIKFSNQLNFRDCIIVDSYFSIAS